MSSIAKNTRHFGLVAQESSSKRATICFLSSHQKAREMKNGRNAVSPIISDEMIGGPILSADLRDFESFK